MRKRDHYFNYSKKSEPVVNEEVKVDVPVEEAGQVEEPEKVEEAVVQRKPVVVEEKSEDKFGCVTNCSLVNVREKADPNAKILGTATNGTKFQVLGTEGNYYKVNRVGIGLGFIQKDFFMV